MEQIRDFFRLDFIIFCLVQPKFTEIWSEKVASNQNILKSDLKKLPNMSHLGPIWPALDLICSPWADEKCRSVKYSQLRNTVMTTPGSNRLFGRDQVTNGQTGVIKVMCQVIGAPVYKNLKWTTALVNRWTFGPGYILCWIPWDIEGFPKWFAGVYLTCFVQ